jgi:hypothetical protein
MIKALEEADEDCALNPRVGSCFASEDFNGRIAKACRHSNKAQLGEAGLLRWVLGRRIAWQ